MDNNDFFLFGARGTGKTWFLEQWAAGRDVLWVNLLQDAEFLKFSRRPGLLRELLATNKPARSLVIIDEIQRVPELLNEIQNIIESPETRSKFRFALTGSSARKLKRGGGNLLAGRALLNWMFPLTHRELGASFSLEKILQFGSLPRVCTAQNDAEREELLDAYVQTYIKEEIRVEQIVRNLDPFLRFIEVAAQMNGEPINYSSIGRECRVDSKMVERYYQILEDTLIGNFIEPFHTSIRKRQSQRSKFYFFDIGVANALRRQLRSAPSPHHYGYGRQFEHFIILELIRLNSYGRRRQRYTYFRTADGAEVDLMVKPAPGNSSPSKSNLQKP
ncbi:MAG: ATP-binding protein [Planctomycetes bacterium]|nr:ATP-binding protein [Planctomycetota bacterium]